MQTRIFHDSITFFSFKIAFSIQFYIFTSAEQTLLFYFYENLNYWIYRWYIGNTNTILYTYVHYFECRMHHKLNNMQYNVCLLFNIMIEMFSTLRRIDGKGCSLWKTFFKKRNKLWKTEKSSVFLYWNKQFKEIIH